MVEAADFDDSSDEDNNNNNNNDNDNMNGGGAGGIALEMNSPAADNPLIDNEIELQKMNKEIEEKQRQQQKAFNNEHARKMRELIMKGSGAVAELEKEKELKEKKKVYSILIFIYNNYWLYSLQIIYHIWYMEMLDIFILLVRYLV